MHAGGNFETATGGSLQLLKTGTAWPQQTSSKDPWLMPEGAERVVKDSRKCMQVIGDGNSYRLIRQTLPLDKFKPGTTWQLTAKVTIPEKLKGISIEAGLNGNKGTIWIDDVKVEKVE